MHGRVRVALVLTALVAGSLAASVAGGAPPVHETGFLKETHAVLPPASCDQTSGNVYEAALWNTSGTGAVYGDDCKRLRFAFGPILAKPGQNDVLIEPVKIEKPAYPGYIVRFKPDLVDQSGAPPGVHEIHLHHATWLNGYPEYGSGPFFAAGEEKTIATFPPGYGMKVGALDTWLLLYMVHNALPTPRLIWITYEIDYVAEEDAAAHNLVPVKPVWLDVQRRPIVDDGTPATDTSGNPVFNVQKGFGHLDTRSFPHIAGLDFADGTNKQVCTWPLENCARHDVYGGVTAQQGIDIAGRIKGADWTVPAEFEGTLIGIGGHLHPGGIRDEVSVVRGGVEKPIFISDSLGWKRGAQSGEAGGPLTSWDFSMTATGSTIGWKVKVKQGDTIRLNAVYDSQDASWYENMGIVVALLAPKDVEKEDALHGGNGVDVFDQPVALDPGFPTTGGYMTPGRDVTPCDPNNDASQGALRLCLRGQVTHGHLAETSVFGGCPPGGCQGLPDKPGRVVDQIVSLGFTFGNADLGVIGQTGLPQLKAGKEARFWNVDTAADVWHTFTRCKEPCTGSYGLDYPLADGGAGPTDAMDFDSTEIGYGLFFSPASGQIGGNNKSTGEALQDGLFWSFKPSTPGVYSLYCRIHPFMRGAFEVVE